MCFSCRNLILLLLSLLVFPCMSIIFNLHIQYFTCLHYPARPYLPPLHVLPSLSLQFRCLFPCQTTLCFPLPSEVFFPLPVFLARPLTPSPSIYFANLHSLARPLQHSPARDPLASLPPCRSEDSSSKEPRSPALYRLRGPGRRGDVAYFPNTFPALQELERAEWACGRGGRAEGRGVGVCNEGRKWDRGNQEKHRKEGPKIKGKGKARDKYINEGIKGRGTRVKGEGKAEKNGKQVNEL